MRLQAKLVQLLLCVCMTAISIAAAGQKESSKASHPTVRKSVTAQETPGPRAFNSADGLAILGAALDSRHRANRHPDCSHFVHELYEQAGFPYQYASSSELYAGVDEFRRVTSPQPGDLAVWHGHVGIIVNPFQHSFFSLQRTGPAVDSYDAPYWKQRGPPRFFRYANASPSTGARGPVQSANVKVSPGTAPRSPVQNANVKVSPSTAPRSAVQNANWKPSARPDADDLSGDPVPDEPQILPTEIDLPPIQPEKTLARTVTVNTAKPKPDEVSAAFLQACKGWEQNLRGEDLFKSPRSLVVFDHFVVKKVQVTASQGWAEVQIDQPASLKASNADTHKRTEHQRWTLTRRDSKVWELTPAPNTIYLPQSVAVRLLASELAQLTADAPDAASNTQHKAQLAHLLDALLEK